MSKATEMFPTQATLEDRDVPETGEPSFEKRAAVCECVCVCFLRALHGDSFRDGATWINLRKHRAASKGAGM